MGRFVPASRLLTEQTLAASPGIKALEAAAARDVLAKAREAAPQRTGYYARHLVADGNRVTSTDPFGHIVEWGSRNSPPYAPLRRGVIAAGLRFDPAPA